jgi:hypothetical protein
VRNDFKVTNQAQKFEGMENHIGFLELNDDCMFLQKCFQDPNTKNQVFSFLDDESKYNKPFYDDYTSQSKNGEEGYVVLDTFECEVNCQNATFLKNTNPIF